ncbi:HAD family phosphatase [Variovorax sp. J22R133]|uniref:HAD family hydrolase n=1 Tax=Variovorax brevis TaxID=3053503 RepID=UPI002575BD33|nr:HAD family phosphatase [Variovorax sp. J22R133]MDM0117696.1 HAD family phosphatase [Variovorax sp. J22R133]
MRTRPHLVLFDIDGVLCHYDRAAFAGTLGALTGRTAEFVREAVWTSGLETRSDRGEVDPDAYLREMSQRLGHPVSRVDWVAARRLAMTPDARVLALAAQVKQRCPLAGLTNNSPMLAEDIEGLCPDIAQDFKNVIVTSAMVGATKPQAEAYLRTIERFGVRPASVLFIDDVMANVEGALSAGLQAFLFVNADQLAQELGEYGLL